MNLTSKNSQIKANTSETKANFTGESKRNDSKTISEISLSSAKRRGKQPCEFASHFALMEGM